MEENIPFWLDDLNILYNKENYLKLYPSRNSTRTEQMNALSRFCIYSIIVMFIFDYDQNYMYIPNIVTIVNIKI